MFVLLLTTGYSDEVVDMDSGNDNASSTDLIIDAVLCPSLHRCPHGFCGLTVIRDGANHRDNKTAAAHCLGFPTDPEISVLTEISRVLAGSQNLNGTFHRRPAEPISDRTPDRQTLTCILFVNATRILD